MLVQMFKCSLRPMSLDKDTHPAPIVRSVVALRENVGAWRTSGQSVALVPTMGALHRGHLALVKKAKQEADRVVVSIFVNPTQFAPDEDFDEYPRTESDDIDKLKPLAVDLIYGPPAREMYSPNFSTRIKVDGVSEGLCSTIRPHFFGGVAVVVAKLLMQCLPDMAIFGEKDYQQLLVIRRMVQDLDIPVEVLSGKTEREEDGLAISSRNVYLSVKERQQAAELNRTLRSVSSDIADGVNIEDAVKAGVQKLKGAGFASVDYLEVRDAENLEPLSALTRPARILGAAHMGKTRLIDNISLKP
jgi:pantoate--beta-alanine ligase